MVNHSPLDHLVIPHQPGEDRQTRRVGRSPACRSQRVGGQVKDRARPGVPSAALLPGGKQLVQLPVILVNDEDVPVSGGVCAALDRRVRRDRIGPRVTFVRVIERYGHFRLGAGDDDVRDPDRRAVPDGTEVRMETGIQADTGDQRVRVGIHRFLRDILVPGIVRRKHLHSGDGTATGRRRSGTSRRGRVVR